MAPNSPDNDLAAPDALWRWRQFQRNPTLQELAVIFWLDIHADAVEALMFGEPMGRLSPDEPDEIDLLWQAVLRLKES